MLDTTLVNNAGTITSSGTGTGTTASTGGGLLSLPVTVCGNGISVAGTAQSSGCTGQTGGGGSLINTAIKLAVQRALTPWTRAVPA